MNIPRFFFTIFFAAVSLNSNTAAAFGQGKCQPPTIAPSSTNIFSPEQEMALGDAVAAHLESNSRVIDDEEVTGNLRRIGQRLIAGMPATKLQFQFFVVDINDVNAFSLPGGRIYVTRKLIAFARDEDELAGVVAHELGHVVARHATNDLSVLFREILGVTSLGDRRDIFEKYNQFIDNRYRKPKAADKLGSREDRDQYAADLVGLYLMAGAGYDPQAQARFWDRYHETKGKTGSFFSSLFGTTKPEQKRLAEMLKQLASLPSDCRAAAHAGSQAEFEKWQKTVVRYSGLGRRESLTGLISRTKLNPTLRSTVYRIRFSPNGKHLLAQDDSGISVLTHKPLASLFRINAPEAYAAQFSPDSEQVVFYTPNLRVEAWDITTHELAWANEVVLRGSCMQTALSPNGKIMACLDEKATLTLQDTEQGTPIYEKKDFTIPTFFEELMSFLSSFGPIAEEGRFINMAFTPDARYFLAGDRSYGWNALGGYKEENVTAFDLNERKSISLKGDLKKLAASGFTFLSANKILSHATSGDKLSVFSFPDGAELDSLPASLRWMATTQDGYAICASSGKAYGAAYNFNTKKFLRPGTFGLLDVYDDEGVTETPNGEIALYPLAATGRPSILAIPENPLGRLYAFDMSSDLKSLAMSSNARGAIWNLDEGKMLAYVRGFRGAYFAEDGFVYLDFPKQDEAPRTIGKMEMKQGGLTRGPDVLIDHATQYGPILLRTGKVDSRDVNNPFKPPNILEAFETATIEKKWQERFPEFPSLAPSGLFNTLVLTWKASSKTAQSEIQSDPELSKHYKKSDDSNFDYFIKVYDLRTGKQIARLVIETSKGAFRIRNMFSNNHFLVVMDTQNRTSVYSLSTGALLGKVFGNRATLSPNVLCVENESGQLTLYSLDTFEQKAQLSFADRIRVVRFTPDGQHLAVVTGNQTAFRFSVQKMMGD